MIRIEEKTQNKPTFEPLEIVRAKDSGILVLVTDPEGATDRNFSGIRIEFSGVAEKVGHTWNKSAFKRANSVKLVIKNT